MTEARAREVIRDLLHNVQKTRSDISEFLDRYGESEGWDSESVERVKADLHRWLFGERGEAFVLLLADLDSGRRPLAPLTLYNVLYVVHRLEPSVAAVATLRGWEIPEPDPTWLRGWDG